MTFKCLKKNQTIINLIVILMIKLVSLKPTSGQEGSVRGVQGGLVEPDTESLGSALDTNS